MFRFVGSLVCIHLSILKLGHKEKVTRMKVECGGRVEAMISTLVEAILAMAMFNTEMASTAEVILAMAMFDTVMVFVAMDKFLSLPSVVIVD